MLVLATFLAVGALFTAFLLRFLFALESEARIARERAEWVKRIRSRRIPSPAGASVSSSGLTLAYSNPAAPAPRGLAQARLAAREASRLKKEA